MSAGGEGRKRRVYLKLGGRVIYYSSKVISESFRGSGSGEEVEGIKKEVGCEVLKKINKTNKIDFERIKLEKEGVFAPSAQN